MKFDIWVYNLTNPTPYKEMFLHVYVDQVQFFIQSS